MRDRAQSIAHTAHAMRHFDVAAERGELVWKIRGLGGDTLLEGEDQRKHSCLSSRRNRVPDILRERRSIPELEELLSERLEELRGRRSRTA